MLVAFNTRSPSVGPAADADDKLDQGENILRSPVADMQRGIRVPHHWEEITLVRVVELIMAKAATACESRAVRAERVVAALRRDVTLGEHRAGGEREQRQSCNQGFHFPSPLFINHCTHMSSLAPEIIGSLLTRAFGRTEWLNLLKI
jgi:hypothetical protein